MILHTETLNKTPYLNHMAMLSENKHTLKIFRGKGLYCTLIVSDTREACLIALRKLKGNIPKGYTAIMEETSLRVVTVAERSDKRLNKFEMILKE